jgi:hypothetical protein
MKYADMMDSLYTKFHTDWFSHSNVDWGDTQTHRKHRSLISLLLFFFKISGLKKRLMRSPCCLCRCLCVCVAPVIFFVFYVVRVISK